MTDDELKAIERRHELAADQAAEDSCNLAMIEAIDDIPTLLAEVERLREALKGLVAVCDDVLDTRRGRVAHLRRLNAARAALEGGR